MQLRWNLWPQASAAVERPSPSATVSRQIGHVRADCGRNADGGRLPRGLARHGGADAEAGDLSHRALAPAEAGLIGRLAAARGGPAALSLHGNPAFGDAGVGALLGEQDAKLAQKLGQLQPFMAQ